MKIFCETVIDLLYHSAGTKTFGGDFCFYKMLWFTQYANGRVTTTVHGAFFFEVVLKALETKFYEYEGDDYDKNLALTLQEHGVTIQKLKKSKKDNAIQNSSGRPTH
jgi:hypothetical protein